MRIRKTISFVLLCSLLISGCSQTAVPANTVASSVDASTTTTAEITTTTSYNAADYPFTWDNQATEDFNKYVKRKYNISLHSYAIEIGFTDELNKAFTDFINERWGTNYSSVPFKKANFFFNWICPDANNNYKDRYDIFKASFLNKERVFNGGFANKLIMSYLVQNKIPFGSRISLENLKALVGEQVYTYDAGNKKILQNPKLGNYDSSYKYSKEELFVCLKRYNFDVYYMSIEYPEKRIKSGNPLEDLEAFDKCNQFFIEFYGESAPKVGQVITPEQYEKIWGEKPLDISYIPGAIVNLPAIIATPEGIITEN